MRSGGPSCEGPPEPPGHGSPLNYYVPGLLCLPGRHDTPDHRDRPPAARAGAWPRLGARGLHAVEWAIRRMSQISGRRASWIWSDADQHGAFVARARRGDRRHQLVPASRAGSLNPGVARTGALELLERLEPRTAERRLSAARAPSRTELPQVRPPRAARSDDVGLALAGAAPRAADAAAGLDVLAAGGAALRDGVVGRRRGDPVGGGLRRRARPAAAAAARRVGARRIARVHHADARRARRGPRRLRRAHRGRALRAVLRAALAGRADRQPGRGAVRDLGCRASHGGVARRPAGAVARVADPAGAEGRDPRAARPGARERARAAARARRP